MPTVYIHSLFYLIPSIVVAILLSRLASRVYLFAILTLPGTFAHELLHWLVGGVFGARPTSISIIPKRGRGNEYTLGTVSFANLRWYNAAPAALAPMLILPAVGAVAFWRVHGGWRYEPLDIALWLGLGPQLLSFWPSNADWGLAMRSWPAALVIAAAAAGYWTVTH
jgi:hypothetical protein